MVGYGVVDPYWGTMLKRMTLYIPTGDGVVGYGAVQLRFINNIPLQCRKIN